jgi:hypothetical protein
VFQGHVGKLLHNARRKKICFVAEVAAGLTNESDRDALHSLTLC